MEAWQTEKKRLELMQDLEQPNNKRTAGDRFGVSRKKGVG